jgi:hypothetical protein
MWTWALKNLIEYFCSALKHCNQVARVPLVAS